MQVLKFGGTSVGSAQRIKDLQKIIVNDTPKLVVLSAMSGTTNQLVAISNFLNNNNISDAKACIDTLYTHYKKVVVELFATQSFIDKGTALIDSHFTYLNTFLNDVFTINEEKAILAQGELLSTALLHLSLNEKNIDNVLLSALEFMKIDENAEPAMNKISENLNKTLANYSNQKLFITQGYICRNSFGEIDNLKRGGSDYTATIIGAAIDASEIQIWTDIDGMHNNDPRIIKNTKPIHELSFDEAAELAYFGAKILHPTCILPAKKKNIPVKILNTMAPQAAGTIIKNGTNNKETIKAVAVKDNIVSINIQSDRMLMAYGFMRSVFEVFERYKTPIDMITTSEVAVTVTIDTIQQLEFIKEELLHFGTIAVEQNLSIICIVGDFSAEKEGIAAKIFSALKNIPIRMIAYGGSKNNISLLVNTDYKTQALTALHNDLFTN